MIIIDNSNSSTDCYHFSINKPTSLANCASQIADKIKLGDKLPWSLYSEIIRDSIRIEDWVARGGEKKKDILIYFNESKTILLEYDPINPLYNKDKLLENSKAMATYWMNRMETTCQTYINLWRFVDILPKSKVTYM